MADLIVPAEVFPPGEFLRDELEAREWTQTEFAEILGRPVRLVNEILAGKRAITPQTANEIAAALGTSPEFWLNLEAAYQLSKTQPAPERIAREAALRERFPIREMIRRGWLENSENVSVLEAQVLRFYGINSLDERPALAHAAKKGGELENYGELTPAQEAWLFRVKQIATALQVAPYSEQRLRDALPRLQALMGEPEEVRHVPTLLAECGVRLVVVEPLPASKIDGVCFWLEGSAWSPVIGLTLRYDRIDNFWFVLRHEIEHVLRRDASLDSDLDPNSDAGNDLPEQERLANEAAQDFCVSTQRIENFIARVHPLYSEQRIIGFSRTLGVHPGLVVGQLQRRLKRYDLLRKHLVKIREIVTQSAMTDGYGRFCPVAF
jgi:HTH-type transcriptional regulator / antitoxin HigA